jgi:hypothetical protein
VIIYTPVTAAVITASVVGLLLAGYGFVMLRRRARLRQAAADIGGVYQHEGWTQPGAIGGPGFTIRVEAPRRKFRTTVIVSAQAPGDYVLDAGFFASPLDWSHVKVPGTVTQRAFIVQVGLPGYTPPSEAQRAALAQWLERGASTHRVHADRLADAGVSRVFVANETITTTVDGMVTDTARLRRIIDVLSRLAGPR